MYLQRTTNDLVTALGLGVHITALTVTLYHELLKQSQIGSFARGHASLPPSSFVAGCIAIMLIAHWGTSIRDQLSPKRWRAVIPGQLYASGQISARLIERTLCQHGIDVVVDLSELDTVNNDQMCELSTCERLKIEHYRLPLEGDGTGDLNCYVRAIEHIVNAAPRDKRVLIHCVAGTQRTGGVLAVYRLLVRRESPEVILRSLRDFGFDESRNPDLLQFLDMHMDAIARRLAQRRVLHEVPPQIPSLQAMEARLNPSRGSVSTRTAEPMKRNVRGERA